MATQAPPSRSWNGLIVRFAATREKPVWHLDKALLPAVGADRAEHHALALPCCRPFWRV
jgi:hypothetical protein